jgi:hypothetical protein
MVRETVSEEQAFSEKQRPFTTKDTEDTEEEQGIPLIHGKPGQVDADERGFKQEQNLFTAKDAEDAKKNQGLPLIHNTDNTDRKSLPRIHGKPGQVDADDRGFEAGIKPVEWRPTPDMYRTDTPEGREAYEACLRMTAARQGGERRPPQPGIAPGDRAEVHYSSLRNERLPKGPRFASEPLDADTGAGSVLQTEPYANLG